jgi:hypothetical protein
MSRALRVILAFILGSLLLAGCVVYETVPAPGPSNFDRAWNAALGGAQDAGVQVTSADPSTRLIRGTRDGIDVTVVVARQRRRQRARPVRREGTDAARPGAQQPVFAGVRAAHGPLTRLATRWRPRRSFA